MRSNLVPDIGLALHLFEALRTNTFDGVGITREAYGPGERVAHQIVGAEAEILGLDVEPDPAGNLLMTLPGADPSAKRIVLGSHLDSVPRGGNYDGAAGVLAGLATLAGMRRAGFQPHCDVTLIAIRSEEGGAWFPTSLPGSRAAIGLLPPEALEVRRTDSGRTLADHMREAGFDPEAVRAGASLLKPDGIAAYLELHIEQGPVLDAKAVPIGIVTGLPGSRRLRAARVVGEYNHSGATPRAFRRDAAVALAELVSRLDAKWQELDDAGRQLVCTFCVMATAPEAGFTKVPGEACFQLDVRSVEPANLDAMYDELHRLIFDIEPRRGVRFELGREMRSAPTPMDAGVRAGLARAARELEVPHIEMPSGGGHDAASFAQAGVPTGMMFVRNQNGSHNPNEAMRTEDFTQAVAVMSRWVANQADGATAATS